MLEDYNDGYGISEREDYPDFAHLLHQKFEQALIDQAERINYNCECSEAGSIWLRHLIIQLKKEDKKEKSCPGCGAGAGQRHWEKCKEQKRKKGRG